jgi:acyl-CoA thioester hydrolase
VRSLVGVHRREARYGDLLHGFTAVSGVRRDTLLNRVTVLDNVLHASVEWVHCGRDGAPTRAPADMLRDLRRPDARTHVTPDISLPTLPPVSPLSLPVLLLEPWWTEMDPVGHVNHPRYVDWADEAVARWLVPRGFDPVGVRPVADALTFRAGAAAGQRVEVRATLVAAAGDAAAFDIAVTADGARAAEGRIVRAHLAGSAAWG